MSFRAFAVGDLHLRKSNILAMFDNADELKLGALRAVFERAVREGIEWVILLGDICDTHILTDYIRAQFLLLLLEFDGRLNIRIILGNHDVAENEVHSLHTLDVLSKAGVFKSIRVFCEYGTEKINGVRLEYLPYPLEEPKHRNSVVFAHFEVQGSMRDNGRIVKDGHNATFKSSNLFVQGHLHTPHRVRNHWYVGTLAQESFGERLPKGFGEFKAHMSGSELVTKVRNHRVQPPWSLYNVVLNTKADIRKYPADKDQFGPNARVKLFVAEGLKLDDAFLTDHPEIVNRLDFQSKADLDQLQEEEFALENQTLSIRHEELLPQQLALQGASKKQVSRAVEIIGALAGKK